MEEGATGSEMDHTHTHTQLGKRARGVLRCCVHVSLCVEPCDGVIDAAATHEVDAAHPLQSSSDSACAIDVPSSRLPPWYEATTQWINEPNEGSTNDAQAWGKGGHVVLTHAAGTCAPAQPAATHKYTHTHTDIYENYCGPLLLSESVCFYVTHGRPRAAPKGAHAEAEAAVHG